MTHPDMLPSELTPLDLSLGWSKKRKVQTFQRTTRVEDPPAKKFEHVRVRPCYAGPESVRTPYVRLTSSVVWRLAWT